MTEKKKPGKQANLTVGSLVFKGQCATWDFFFSFFRQEAERCVIHALDFHRDRLAAGSRPTPGLKSLLRSRVV